MGRYRVGVDIGGTFTDFCLYDVDTGMLLPYKVPSTRTAPARAVGDGLRALRDLGHDPREIDYFVHGATIAINTVLQRNGANIALLVTQGFRDLLEIQRLRLKHPFDFRSTRPTPLVPRARVFEIDERILTDGSVDRPLLDASVIEAVRQGIANGAEAFAICLLNAYRNPAHERRVAELTREHAPGVAVSVSTDVWPQMREYERATATVMNAYTQPGVSAYLAELSEILSELECDARPYITKSNGGVMTTARARLSTAEMLLSGPASGVTGAAYVAERAGYDRLITLDLGGTSADIAVVVGGKALSSQEEHIGDFPVIIPTVAVSSIGAGGGSIATVDHAGVLKVGPESAGADPGPACYDRGGTQPTLTDAFLIAGLFDPERFLGGRLKLDPARAHQTLEQLGQRLGLDVVGTARAVITVATASMYSEFSSLIAKRGLDPRDFTLVAFGGAGALVACALAREFRMSTVLVPPSPGTLCALGALAADVINDHIKTLNARVDTLDAQDVLTAYGEMRKQADMWLAEEGPRLEQLSYRVTADTRYEGQAYEIEVPVDIEELADRGPGAIAEAHHVVHERLYAHADPHSRIELVNLRLRVTGRMPRPELKPVGPAEAPLRPTGARTVHIEDTHEPASVYPREDMRAGHVIVGPAIVEQADTTVFIPTDMRAIVDEWGNLIVNVRPGAT